jgi:ABC-type phosphate transport system substrate-binding protein
MSAFKQKAGRLGVRAGILAGASAAILAISGLGATSALANPACPQQGENVNIQGKGASLQRVAQQEWTGREVTLTDEPLAAIPHAEKNKGGYFAACNAKTNKDTVSYTSVGSGKGLAAWNYDGASGKIDRTLDFIGSDDPPTLTQISNGDAAANGITAAEAKTKIEAGTALSTNALIIPVAQTSITVAANLPTGCTITENKITGAQLQQVFNAEITKWSELTGASGCGTNSITRVVREDGSGTTYQFKHYLSTKKSTELNCASELPTGHKTWATLQENNSGASPNPNLVWPCNTGATAVVRGNGGGGVVTAIAATKGRIGYAALPDALGKAVTLLKVEGISPEASGKKANCSGAAYTVPTGGSLNRDWSAVYPSAGTTYPICTLTYDLAWTSYSTVNSHSVVTGSPAYTANRTAVTKDYLRNYLVEEAEEHTTSTSGQKMLEGEIGYAPLTSNVLTASKAAAALIAF